MALLILINGIWRVLKENHNSRYRLRRSFHCHAVVSNSLDIIPRKIEQLNNKISPIADTEIEGFLANKGFNFTATLDKELAYKNVDFVIIAKPTVYDTTNKYFNTSTEEVVMQMLSVLILLIV